MTEEQRGFFGRLRSFVQGLFGSWMSDRERRNPRVVYEQAIEERTRQYRHLKHAVAGILYMRNKLEAEIADRRAEIAQLSDDVRRAVKKADDELALTLIARKQGLEEELERTDRELVQVRTQAEEAKGNLASFREEIRGLEREKVRMLATLANARARRRIQEALDGLSVDADMRALEGVREYVARVSTEGRLDQELGDDGMQARVREIRSDARREASRRELEEIKRRLVPEALPGPRPDAAVETGAFAGGRPVPVGAR